MNRTISLCLLGLLTLSMTMGPVKKDAKRPSSDSRVRLLHSDRLYFNQRLHPTAQFLVGDVQFEHDGTYMWCDSALFYESTNSFDAFGNVRMKQGDTLSLTSEEMFYDGLDQLVRSRHNVVLRHRQTTLFTDSLDYDRLYDVGYFFDGGKMIDNDNQLTSDWGEYTLSTRDAVFNYNVRLVSPRPPKNPKSTLVSDTLYYNTNTEVAHVVGPSNIDDGDNHIYTENGYYDSKTDFSYVLDRSIMQNGCKFLVGDSVCWDGNTRIGKAYSNVVYKDTLNKNMFTGNYALYNDSTGYAEAADSAVLIDYSQKDTMFAHADSFFLYTYNIETDSVYRIMHAYHHVRAYRKDVQAVCDSMVYDSRDSCTTMYKDPIVWQEKQQLLGELIKAWNNDSTIDSVYVINQALSVERVDDKHYNQVSSKEMHSYFRDGDIYLTVADVNALLNYFPFDDDSLMIGMNHTESATLRLFLEDGKVDRVWCGPAATGVLYPLLRVAPQDLYLDNFAWFDYIRPKDKDDIFVWRPKKKGTELKQSVVHEAPLQKLDKIKGNSKKKEE